MNEGGNVCRLIQKKKKSKVKKKKKKKKKEKKKEKKIKLDTPAIFFSLLWRKNILRRSWLHIPSALRMDEYKSPQYGALRCSVQQKRKKCKIK